MIYFQLPFDQTIYTIDSTSSDVALVFRSFDNTTSVEFKGKIVSVAADEIPISATLPIDESGYSGESKEEYSTKLNQLIHDISEKKLAKVVLSRRKIVENNGKIDIQKTFVCLCEAYPNAFKYVFIKNNKAWIGAFSEVLGKYDTKSHNFQTMSLAGTLPKEASWSQKEIEEQKPVTLYIKNILDRYSNKVVMSETYDHISGAIKHLRTDFEINIGKELLKPLIAELHPTPAVCGVPKNDCFHLITQYEKYPRELYAGYSEVEINGTIYYFVNLRCAKMFSNRTHVFVGGGITAKSHPEKEWQETELKAQAILDNIRFLS